MKTVLLLLIGVLGLATGVAVILISRDDAAEVVAPVEVETTCLKGVFLIPNEFGALFAFGEQELCGQNLQFSEINGPTDMPNPVRPTVEPVEKSA